MQGYEKFSCRIIINYPLYHVCLKRRKAVFPLGKINETELWKLQVYAYANGSSTNTVFRTVSYVWKVKDFVQLRSSVCSFRRESTGRTRGFLLCKATQDFRLGQDVQ